MSWKPSEFHVAINMAGAISAGAYTAGVLDFLMEALEEWQKEKEAFHEQLANLQPGGSITNVVPLHDIQIDAFTGASAGGMCAAIAAVMVQGDFAHIKSGDETGTNNTFYEGWVNQIDIREFLKATDLADGSPLVSLLDCTVIDKIAEAALVLGTPNAKPYITPNLTLLMTMTNVRGVSYPLYDDASMSVDEYTAYYGDKLRFEIVPSVAAPVADGAKPLPLDSGADGAWPLLKDAAKATGAFPLFLAPRKLTRDLSDYRGPVWQSLCTPTVSSPIKVDLPAPPPATWTTLNVDGGLTDNDPFELAHDFLAQNNPSPDKPSPCQNPTDSLTANCCVLSIAPFPAIEKYDANYFTPAPGKSDPTNLLTMVGRLITVLLSQSRFFGESLPALTSGVSFSRFVIAPSDPDHADSSALQSGTLGAFGGFLDRRFRKHDYLLGRRNCQRFLDTEFLLPFDNKVIATGLSEAGPFSGSVKSLFKRKAPNPKAMPQNEQWLPIIPLCGSAKIVVDEPIREQMTDDDLDRIADLAIDRIKSIKGQLLANAPGLLKFLAGCATAWPFSGQLKGALKEQLRKGLGPNITEDS